MRCLDLADRSVITFAGAVGVRYDAGTAQPLRLPLADLPLHHDALVTRASAPAGVRLVTLSDTTHLRLHVQPVDGQLQWSFDLLGDGRLLGRVQAPTTQGVIDFGDFAARAGLPRRARKLELYLTTQYVPCVIQKLEIDDDACALAAHDPRPRWITYGSSITHAKEAAGPSETWAALVARQFNLHHTNLGYGGQEHLDPYVGHMIANLPCELLSICVGGNIWGGSSFNERSYRASIYGMLHTFRAAFPRIPLAVCSFIHSRHDENAEVNKVGLIVDDYRRMTRQAVETWRALGDSATFYVHGPDLFGAADMHLCDDGVHPNAEGQRLLAQRFAAQVMTKMLAAR